MTKRITIALLLVFSGCATSPPVPPPYDLVMAQNDCAAQGAPFELLSGCLQSQMQQHAPEWVIGRDADLLSVYFSWLAAAGNRVTTGEMPEEAARRQSSELLARLRAIDSQRQAAMQATARQLAIANALTGFALMNQPPQTGPMITCRTVPTGLGTTMTTCQ